MASLVAATQGRVRRAWLATVAHLREVNTVDGIELGIHRTYGHEPLTGVEDAGRRWAAGRHGAYIAAGQTTSRWIDHQLQIARKAFPVFDATDPPAVRWAQQNTLEGIREVTDDTRAMIRQVLLNGARSGTNPRVLAAQIRDSIGLTRYHLDVVENYRKELESGQYAAALERELSHGQSDRVIAAALRNETTLTQAQIDKAVDRYRANMVRARAETIARTEALKVAHQGSDEMYRQAIAGGDLKADDLEQEWHTSHLTNVRATHEPMDGQTRAFGESFESGAGVALRYPCDPQAPVKEIANCACVKTTRIISVPLRPVQIAPEPEDAAAPDDIADESDLEPDEQDDLEKAGWSEDDHPRDDHGRFSEGGGGASAVTTEDVSSALRDRTFVTEHVDRLLRAGDELRAQYPENARATDAVHALAQAAIHDEATRILTEHAAASGDRALLSAAGDAHAYARVLGATMAEQHAAAMGAISSGRADLASAAEVRQVEDAAIAAGHVTSEVRDIAASYLSERADAQRLIDDNVRSLGDAQTTATRALDDLHAYEHSGNDREEGVEFTTTRDVNESINVTREALSDVSSATHSADTREPQEAVDFPDTYAPHPEEFTNGTYDDDEEGPSNEHEAADMLASHVAYTERVNAFNRELNDRADIAQRALESLGSKQRETLAAFATATKHEEAARERALDRLANMEEGETIRDVPMTDTERENAETADVSMHERATEQIYEGAFDASDATRALRHEIKTTSAAIRELSRITGRKPAVPRAKR